LEAALVTGRARGALTGERPAAARRLRSLGIWKKAVPCSGGVQYEGELGRCFAVVVHESELGWWCRTAIV